MSAETELTREELRRTARHLNLPGFGIEQQRRLHAAHVLVVGAGGLGCPALQQLTAVGVGKITIIDDDTVDLTNIHRQILFTAGDVGKPKVEVAAARIRGLQPGIEVRELRRRLDSGNAVEIVGGVDLVLDGSDSFGTKYLVADAAEITSTPLVWGTVLQYRGDVALWHSGTETEDGRGVGLRDIFPVQPGGDFVPDCATAGVLGVTTSVVAGLMVTQVVAHLAQLPGAGTPGRLTSYEALSARMRTLEVQADPGRTLVSELEQSYEVGCAMPGEAAAEEAERQRLLGLVRDGRAVAVDIREPHEVLLKPWPDAEPVLLPGSEISSIDDLPEFDKDLVVACAAGVRSARFVENYGEQLSRRGIQALSLPGGVNSLSPSRSSG